MFLFLTYFTLYNRLQFHLPHSVQFSHSVMPESWGPMDSSMPGFPVHHQLPELAQTHVHWVGDAIQPSHPLLSPSPPALNLSQHQGLFQCISSSHQVAKLLEFQLQFIRTDSNAFFFYSWIIFHCVYVQLPYPFVCWWTSRLLPCLSNCKHCWNDHWFTHVSFSSGFLGVYAQQWDCWVIWQFYFQSFKESPNSSP